MATRLPRTVRVRYPFDEHVKFSHNSAHSKAVYDKCRVKCTPGSTLYGRPVIGSFKQVSGESWFKGALTIWKTRYGKCTTHFYAFQEEWHTTEWGQPPEFISGLPRMAIYTTMTSTADREVESYGIRVSFRASAHPLLSLQVLLSSDSCR